MTSQPDQAPKWCPNPEKWADAPTPQRVRVYMGGKKYLFGYLVPEGETAMVADDGSIISYIAREDLSLQVDKHY